jgi:hypothetical protein
VLLLHFWLGLSKEPALRLNIATRGSFTHKTTAEGEALLDRILENTPPLEPLYVELEPIHEEVSLAKANPVTPIERPSPEPKDLEEGFQPSDFPFLRTISLKILETPRTTDVKRGHPFLSPLLSH